MKCFIVVLGLVAFSRASVLKASEDIPAPTLNRLVSLDPPGFRIEWNPVKSRDETDPIIGYKVKVWEQQSKKIYEYQMVDGVYTLVEQTVLDKFPFDQVPDWEPKEVVVEGADSTATQYDNIKLGILYEIRVQAFSKKFEGPLSRPMRIKLEEQ